MPPKLSKIARKHNAEKGVEVLENRHEKIKRELRDKLSDAICRLSESEAEIVELKKTITQKDEEIAELKVTLMNKDEIEKQLENVEKALESSQQSSEFVTLNNSEMFHCSSCEKNIHVICSFQLDSTDSSHLSSSICLDCQRNGSMSIEYRLDVLLEMEVEAERTLKNNKDMLDEVTKELESIQKLFKEPGPTRVLLDNVLKTIGCDSRVWFQQLTGNQARTLLRPENIRKVLAVFPSDSSDNITVMEEVMMDLSALMTSANNQEKTDEEIDGIERLLWRIERNLRVAQPTSSVTPKLHMLTAHLIPYLRLHRSWGHLTEQGIEHLHAVVNALHLRFASVPDPELNAILVLKHLSNFNFLFDIGQSWFQSD